MAGEKVAPPKPEGLKKKEERDTKFATALKELRQKRREENKTRRGEATKRAQQYEEAYQKATRAEIEAKRNAKHSGQIYVPAQPRLAFVIRIRGINKLSPNVIRIMRLLRLRQLHNGVFIKINKASVNMLRRVEPYVTYGYPSRETIRKLILKRGFGKVNRQRIPLTDNKIIHESLNQHNISSVEDLVNEIYSVGNNFKQANNFLWPFKLRGPRGGFSAKRHPFQRRGDWGNREEYINQLIGQML